MDTIKEVVFCIKNIEEFGKLMAFCINNDVSVFRTYWDEREKGIRCYKIDWREKRCYYSDKHYWTDNDYLIVTPEFYLDDYGNYKVKYAIDVKEVGSDEVS